MTQPGDTATEADFIDAPRDALLKALYEYWDTVRGNRPMPSRADIDPGAIRGLLPHIIMYTVAADYAIRLVGDDIVRFTGRNATGHPVASTMSPRSAEIMIKILDAVTTERAPKFRAGKTHWQADKTYYDFEACFLPLSTDGKTVDIILGGIRFPTLAQI
jgi:hypothetical protein